MARIFFIRAVSSVWLVPMHRDDMQEVTGWFYKITFVHTSFMRAVSSVWLVPMHRDHMQEVTGSFLQNHFCSYKFYAGG